MPIYEYRCSACGHELERLQRMSEEPLTDCPECEEATLRRLISAAGFRLKGSGWYETDFKKGGKRNVADSSSDSSGSDSNKDSGSKSSEPASTNTGSSDSGSSESSKKESKPTSDSGGKADSKKATAA